MAALTKSRAKKPLAESGLMLAKSAAQGACEYTISIRADTETPEGRALWYTLRMNEAQAQDLVRRMGGLLS